MKKYSNPVLEIYALSMDVITTSGGDPADNLGSDDNFSALPSTEI